VGATDVADASRWCATSYSRTMAERNPTWARDELLLALDLYLRIGPQSARHPSVIELSGLLNSLPIHTSRPDLDRFRNANGVALKLANFAAVDPSYNGRGMTRGGRGDRELWDEFYGRSQRVHELAAAIQSKVRSGVSNVPVEGEDERGEGRLRFGGTAPTSVTLRSSPRRRRPSCQPVERSPVRPAGSTSRRSTGRSGPATSSAITSGRYT
jgi:hypothetical protein